jgi:spermidine/putrescine transport system substrate-binding protein
MKRRLYFSILIFVIIIGSLSFYSNIREYKRIEMQKYTFSNTLNLCQDKNEIPEEIILDFEKKYNISVELIKIKEDITNSSQIESQIKKCDLHITELKNIKKLISMNLLEKINIKNIKNIKNIDYKILKFDLNLEKSYSVPYTYGTIGIMYNTKYFIYEPSIDKFWSSQYKNKAGMINDPYSIISFLYSYIGIKIKEDNFIYLQGLENFFNFQKNNIIFEKDDSIIEKMRDEEIIFSAIKDSDYFALDEPNLLYYLPYGSIFWMKNFVIPQTSKNKKGADYFIDYILNENISKKIIQETNSLMPVNLESLNNERLINYANSIEYEKLTFFNQIENTDLFNSIKQYIEDSLEVKNE